MLCAMSLLSEKCITERRSCSAAVLSHFTIWCCCFACCCAVAFVVCAHVRFFRFSSLHVASSFSESMCVFETGNEGCAKSTKVFCVGRACCLVVCFKSVRFRQASRPVGLPDSAKSNIDSIQFSQASHKWPDWPPETQLVKYLSVLNREDFDPDEQPAVYTFHNSTVCSMPTVTYSQ